MDEVLVVGGRATGLTMAAELARRGVPTRCIDASPGIDPHVRANLLHSRTLEIFQGLGLDDQLTLGSVSERGLVFYRDGKRVGESPHEPIDSPFPYGLSQSQAHTEATIEAHLNSFGVQVERNVSLAAMAQDEDCATVTLSHDGKQNETCRYQWVIGCDGANSTTRNLLGASFPGVSDDIPYILGDVALSGNEDLEPDKGHIFFHASGELYLFTQLPGDRQFIVATLEKGTGTSGKPPLEDLQAIVTRRGRASVRLSDPHWLGYFWINYRLAQFYRKDRAFLAGDAAHVHSLLAGQGMNTGIQDAHNLAWKLALVVHGKAKPEILDTYEIERRGVADEVIQNTRQITDVMESYGDLTGQERDNFISKLFTSDPAKLDAARHLQEVDLDYSNSPLCLSSEDEFKDGPGPGMRAPDAGDLEVAGQPKTFYRLPADQQYRLLFFCGDPRGAPDAEIKDAADASLRFAHWLTPYIVRRQAGDKAFGEHTVIVDRQGNLHRRYAASKPCIYLIRPDGYVAFRSEAICSVDRYFEAVSVMMA